MVSLESDSVQYVADRIDRAHRVGHDVVDNMENLISQ